jgi:hypothetical protein
MASDDEVIRTLDLEVVLQVTFLERQERFGLVC